MFLSRQTNNGAPRRVWAVALTVFSVILALSIESGEAKADATAETFFKIWYERAHLGQTGLAAAIESDAPVTIYKWYSPLKILALLDDDTGHGPELQAYLKNYLNGVIETTNMTAAIARPNSGVIPNVIIVTGSSVRDAVNRHENEITAMMEDGGKEVGKLLADSKSEEINCQFSLKTKDSIEITKAVLVVPVAEDIFATQKCLGRLLFNTMGMFGEQIEGESVLIRADAAILPTDDDRRALRIHYINQIQDGDTPSEIISVINKAIQQGVLQ
jgi:hypothetical protein